MPRATCCGGDRAAPAWPRWATKRASLVPHDATYWRKSLTPEGYARELALQVIGPAPRRSRTSGPQHRDRHHPSCRARPFGQLLSAVSGHGRQVIVVILPAANTWPLRNPIDITCLRRAANEITTEARSSAATVVDLSGLEYPDTDYTDTVHLNATGAARFSRDARPRPALRWAAGSPPAPLRSGG